MTREINNLAREVNYLAKEVNNLAKNLAKIVNLHFLCKEYGQDLLSTLFPCWPDCIPPWPQCIPLWPEEFLDRITDTLCRLELITDQMQIASLGYDDVPSSSCTEIKPAISKKGQDIC